LFSSIFHRSRRRFIFLVGAAHDDLSASSANGRRNAFAASNGATGVTVNVASGATTTVPGDINGIFFCEATVTNHEGASATGGFFVIAKPPAAILPRTGRKLFTKCEAKYAKRLLAGCTPSSVKGASERSGALL
jgi:hypothetical protein